jgi:starvation-inducible DNA-binding protein
MRADKTKTRDLKLRRDLPVSTPTGLGSDATRDLAAALNGILADVFARISKPRTFTGT